MKLYLFVAAALTLSTLTGCGAEDKATSDPQTPDVKGKDKR